MSNWIDAIISPLKAAGEVAQGLVDIRDTVKFGDAVIKLQGQILAAQQGALSAQTRETQMMDEIRALKARVVELETWEAGKKRYQLERLPPGVFIYKLKSGDPSGEPSHSICQTCYQRGKKSVLNSDEPGHGIYHLTCHECGTVLEIGHYSPPQWPRTAIEE
jgi:hypothetical protein